MTDLDNKTCPLSKESWSDCIKVANNWDTEQLFKDLAWAKTYQESPKEKDSKTHSSQVLNIKMLEDKEKCYLCLLLNGLSFDEMSRRLNKSKSTIKSQICETIYKYIKDLTETSVGSPFQVSHILEKHEYRKPQISSIRVINANPNAHNSDVVEDREMIATPIELDVYINFPQGGLPKVIRKSQH